MFKASFTDLYTLLLILARLGVALSLLPGLGGKQILPQVRIWLVFLLGVGLTFSLKDKLPSIPSPDFGFAILLLQEALIGFFIGMLIRLLFLTLDIAGDLIAFQMGLSASQALNPHLDITTSVLGSFLSVAGITLIFITDTHHLMLKNLVASYDLFSSQSHWAPYQFLGAFIVFVKNSFLQAVSLSFPFLLINTLFQMVLGLLNRLVPQVQIYFVSLPLQIIIGLLVLTLTIAGVLTFFLENFQFYLTRAG